ncbi:MAG: hypothetical protein R3E76_09915 [Planctomycetota bacterium]
MQFLAYGRMFETHSAWADSVILMISIPLLGWLGMKLWNRAAERTPRIPHVAHWVYAAGVSAGIQLLALSVFWVVSGQTLNDLLLRTAG